MDDFDQEIQLERSLKEQAILINDLAYASDR